MNYKLYFLIIGTVERFISAVRLFIDTVDQSIHSVKRLIDTVKRFIRTVRLFIDAVKQSIHTVRRLINAVE